MLQRQGSSSDPHAMDRRLKDSRPAESAAAAAEFVALTNNSSKDEDVVIGKTGALEVAFS